MWFRLPVLGLIAFLVVYHLIGTALEFRRRGYESRRQEALLEAVRHGIAVMSRAGNATSMLEALADGGPFEVRPLFREIVVAGGSGPAGETFVRELERIRERVAVAPRVQRRERLEQRIVIHRFHDVRVEAGIE